MRRSNLILHQSGLQDSRTPGSRSSRDLIRAMTPQDVRRAFLLANTQVLPPSQHDPDPPEGQSSDHLTLTVLTADPGGVATSRRVLTLTYDPHIESYSLGFRVASVPEPCSLVLLGLGGLVLRRKH